MRHLPRLVLMLNGTPERKAMVKAAFNSIVIVPPQTFINSNQPRVRQSELLTPAELMMFLHDVEKDVGLKQAIEGTILIRDDVQQFITVPPTAISICFSMTDVYRSEVLAVVMQQIVDESVLPVLFLRTVSIHGHLLISYLMSTPTGHAGCCHLQITHSIRLLDLAFPTDYQEDLDKSTTVGGLHSLRKANRALLFRRTPPVTEGAVEGFSRKAARYEGKVEGLCIEEGRK
jgi:Symplekin tight junction protein C terminal